MQEFFAHLINKAYRIYQGKLTSDIPLANIAYYLEFGGFQLSYNWYGRTRIAKELVGNLIIYRKIIHLDIRFAYNLANLTSSDKYYDADFSLERLVHTIAHEVAHGVISDYNFKLVAEHSEAHKNLTEEIEKYLWNTPEIQELVNLRK